MTEKKRSKKEQKHQAHTLVQMFAKIDKDKELVSVVLQRSTWEEIAYSIKLALKEK